MKKEMIVKFKKHWRPPWRCRVFGHRFRETIYEITVITGLLSSTLEVCPVCGAGRHMTMGRRSHHSPEAVHTFINRREMAVVKKEGDVVPGNFNEQG